jgi:hypothetical protein
MFDQHFPKADPVPRGCGDREPGGVYAECVRRFGADEIALEEQKVESNKTF